VQGGVLMKLDCAVVRDLYVLYEQNELSEPVKAAVKEHIEQCRECNLLYETGQGFTYITDNINSYDVPDKLHTSLMMKLNKKRRLIAFLIAVLLVLSTFLSYIIKDFTESRNVLARDSHFVSWEIRMLSLTLNYVKEDKLEDLLKEQTTSYFKQLYGENSDYKKMGPDHGSQWYTDFKENHMSIYSVKLKLDHIIGVESTLLSDDLNKYEKRYMQENYYDHLSIAYPLYDAVTIMKKRYENNQWTEDDEKYFVSFKDILDKYSILMKNEGNRLSDIGRGKRIDFSPNIDIKSIVDYHRNINDLSMEYVKKYQD
jgi:hypothetical protein